LNRLKRATLSLKELGPGQLLDYAVYKAQLQSGKFETLTPIGQAESAPCLPDFASFKMFDPNPLEPDQRKAVLTAADEIVAGQYRPFGGEPAPLTFDLPESPLQHWTKYGDTLAGQDIKTIWEPARFIWTYPLLQAYLFTKDDRYPQVFWQYFESFIHANPVNAGPNWASGQEVALRLIPWLAAAQIFAEASATTPARKQLMANAIWQHTLRIPPTLSYARSQNNNHYLSEALGLTLGGSIFAALPQGKRWLQQGFQAFQEGLLHQISADGTYSQHSNNYHRMMLHLALLFMRVCRLNQLAPSQRVKTRLASATQWLAAQADQTSGQVPNLGHNDGSNLLPIGCVSYADYRPTLQAASLAFCQAPLFESGNCDELPAWLGIKTQENAPLLQPASEAIRLVGDSNTWGTLRSVRFHSRPAHADLLHVDLWWQGQNFALDAGTYAYNLPAPWQNSLGKTCVHNTVTVAGQDQMLAAGKFLWLQRAESHTFPPQPNEEVAILFCNLPVAYTQVRSLKWLPGQGFAIRDSLELARKSKEPTSVTIQWLLPDWHWEWHDDQLRLMHEDRSILLQVSGAEVRTHEVISAQSVSLIRAGETLLGAENDPIRGWVSPTYLQKIPALSLAVTFETQNSLEINSIWTLSKIE